MTEAEWIASEDPQAMLRWLTDTDVTPDGPDVRVGRACPSDRLLRLFACACSRRFEKPMGVWMPEWEEDNEWTKTVVHINFANCALSWTEDPQHHSEVANLLRDIIGNPFRPVTLPSGPCKDCGKPVPAHRQHIHVAGPCPWLTPTVLSIAEQAYLERPGRKCSECNKRLQQAANLMAGSMVPALVNRGVQCELIAEEMRNCHDCHGTGHIADGSLDPLTFSVLADALEDAGCDNETLLTHLRGYEWTLDDPPGGIYAWLPLRGPHVRGCWALDCILGKS